MKARRFSLMRRAGVRELLLLCLCICLGIFAAGCSAGEDQNAVVSDSGEYQAENEASDTGSGDLDGSEQLERKEEISGAAFSNEVQTAGTEQAAAEESVIPEDITVYSYDSMENVLAAMVSAMQDEEISRYYRDMCDNDLAVDFLYFYVNMFDHDTFASVNMSGKKHDSYARVDRDYLDNLLVFAFGNAITASNLKSDGDLVLIKGSDYYVALDDLQPVQVDYTGFENEAYTESTVFPFDYELYLSNGDTEDGIMQVKFQESDKSESGIILKTVAVSRY